MPKNTKTKHEDDLGPDGARFYAAAVAEHSFEEPARLILLEACRALDLAGQARADIARNGLTVESHRGRIESPSVKTMRSAIATALSCCRLLGIALPEGR